MRAFPTGPVFSDPGDLFHGRWDALSAPFPGKKSHAGARTTKESLAAVLSDAVGVKGNGRALAIAQVYLA